MWQKTDDGGMVWAKRDGFYGSTLRPSEVEREERKANRSPLRLDILKANDVAGVTVRARRELRDLPRLLDETEEVLAVATARLNDERGLLVATNKRVIFYFSGWAEETFRSIHYMVIYGCRVSSRGFLRTVVVNTEFDSVSFRFVWGHAAKQLQSVVSNKVSAISPSQRAEFEMDGLVPKEKVSRVVKRNDIIADQIIDLDTLFSEGGVEESVYKIRKKELLDKMS